MNESRKKINICLSDRFTCKNGLYGSGTSDWQCSQTENVRNLRGTFAIVKEYDNKVECICDIIRSIPIFYYIGEFDVYISDKVETILMKVKEKIDINLISIKEYLMLGYVSETNTLFNQIYTVCAGERVTISDAGGVFHEQYFKLKYSCDSKKALSTLVNEYDNILMSVYKDLVKRLDGRRAIVTLSAGLDSRTSLVCLKRLGYKNITCITFGKEDSLETRTAMEIAQKLDVKCYRSIFPADKVRNNYRKFGNDITNYGDAYNFLFLNYADVLKSKNFSPSDTVIISGHSLSLLTGDHHPDIEKYMITKEGLLDSIYDNHCFRFDIKESDVTEKWRENLGTISNEVDFISEFYSWEWRNRHSRFIVNEIRESERQGYSFEIPFWDTRLADFWGSVPADYLKGRALQMNHVEKIIDPYIGIKKPTISDEKSLLSILKSSAHKMFPRVMKYYMTLRRTQIYGLNINGYDGYYSRSDWKYMTMRAGYMVNIFTYIANEYISDFSHEWHDNIPNELEQWLDDNIMRFGK